MAVVPPTKQATHSAWLADYGCIVGKIYFVADGSYPPCALLYQLAKIDRSFRPTQHCQNLIWQNACLAGVLVLRGHRQVLEQQACFAKKYVQPCAIWRISTVPLSSYELILSQVSSKEYTTSFFQKPYLQRQENNKHSEHNVALRGSFSKGRDWRLTTAHLPQAMLHLVFLRKTRSGCSIDVYHTLIGIRFRYCASYEVHLHNKIRAPK